MHTDVVSRAPHQHCGMCAQLERLQACVCAQWKLRQQGWSVAGYGGARVEPDLLSVDIYARQPAPKAWVAVVPAHHHLWPAHYLKACPDVGLPMWPSGQMF